MYLKMTGTIEFCCVHEIVIIDSNKKKNDLNLNGILLTR
jgi:hypothetical protein